MYRIGILGHSTDQFVEPEGAKRLVEQTIDVINYQYDSEDLVFNIAAEAGVGEWASKFCLDNHIKYHMFLPFPIGEVKDMLLDEQYKSLKHCFDYSWETTVSFSEPDSVQIQLEANNKWLVSDSDFVMYFWNGMKQGPLYDSIKHALKNNILSINGMKDRKLITNEDL